MKIVKYPDGSYALRKFSLLYLRWVYKDLYHGPYWWDSSSNYFRDCKGTIEDIKRFDPRCVAWDGKG